MSKSSKSITHTYQLHTKENRRDEFNRVMGALSDFLAQDFALLSRHLLKNGYSLEDIAQILGVSRQAVLNKIQKRNRYVND